MTEPLRMRELRTVESSQAPASDNFEYFVTTHSRRPGIFDMRPFADGAANATAPRKARATYISFSGRPTLAKQIFQQIKLIYGHAPTATAEGITGSLRWWWRFFDMYQEQYPVTSVADLNDLHYALYRQSPCSPSYVRMFVKLANAARIELGMLPLTWIALEKPAAPKNLVNFDDVKRLYHYCKRPAFAALDRYANDSNAYPTKAELQALFCIFILNTGWNQQVALDIDVDKKDDNNQLSCITPHPHNTNFSIVNSVKARAGGRSQVALSRNKSVLSPSNIILTLLKQTESLRTQLREFRESLDESKYHDTLPNASSSHILAATLDSEIMSPWLFFHPHVRRTVSPDTAIRHIGSLKSLNGSPLKRWAIQMNSQLKPGQRLIDESITLSDFRDAFISWRWESSGYSWLDTMIAAGHGNRRSLEKYLNKRQHQLKSREDFLIVTESIWESILKSGTSTSRTGFATLVAAKSAKIPEEQICRWLEDKDTTYVGVGCIDFFNPPKAISPNHQVGEGCHVQRCTLCPTHAILLPSSYVHLAKRLAELYALRQDLPLLSWTESDFPIELVNTESALSRYDGNKVSKLIKYWEEEISSGRHVALELRGNDAG